MALRITLLAALFVGVWQSALLAARPDGELEVVVVDNKTGQPLPARMHLMDARKRPVRGQGLAAHGDHFYIDGSLTLGLRRGHYSFLVDAGWERRTRFSTRPFEIERRSEDTQTLRMDRYADLNEEGWHAADLDADRELPDLGVVLRAEGVSYAPLIEWRAEGGRWKQTRRNSRGPDPPPGAGLHGARIDTADGALLLFRTDAPVDRTDLPSADEPTIAELRAARDKGYRVVAADLTSWRLPVWLSAGVIDAACVIDRTSGLDSVDPKLSNGRPKPRILYPGEHGHGRWREAIYFHALNAGFRLPAVAGSGTGPTPSPLATNRVYAHCGQEFSADSWWRAALDGQTVVTNGPLLRPNTYGEPPGFVFPLDSRGEFSASIGMNLSSRGAVEYLELIQDGDSVATVRLEELAESGGRLPEIDFTAPGWFTIRAVANDESRYQLALSGPFYVGAEPRISRKSCEFFLEWLEEGVAQDRSSRDAENTAAKEFWRSRLQQATAD